MTAARTGRPEVLKVLLAYGANPNARESARGQTALMWAAGENNAAAVKVLVEGGADIRARTGSPAAERPRQPPKMGPACSPVPSTPRRPPRLYRDPRSRRSCSRFS